MSAIQYSGEVEDPIDDGNEGAMEGILAQRAQELAQLQKTHDEYVKSSCEYERELETEVDRYEKKTQALTQALDKAEHDKQSLHVKLEDAGMVLETGQRRYETLLAQMQEMKWKIQRLEQTNDELETAARVAQATIANLEYKSDQLIEQTVFLQQEKEELQRQLSSIVIAEVHPSPSRLPSLSTSASSSFRGPSLRFSRKASSHVLIEVAATALTNGTENSRKVRSRGSYPDVVESCLHLTCRQCQANPLHRHCHISAEPQKKSLGFFEKLRLKLFGEEDDAV